MRELRTVGDFEEVARALKNPRSKQWEYIVQPYGYCTFCEALTPYTVVASIEENYVTCRACNESFGWSGGTQFLQRGQYITDTADQRLLPPEAREFKRLNGRKSQRLIFESRRTMFGTTLKTQKKNLQKDIKRLAAL